MVVAMSHVNVKHLWAQNPRATALSEWCDKEKGRGTGLADALGVRKETLWQWGHQVMSAPVWAILAIEVLTKGAVPAQSWLGTRCSVKVMRETIARAQDRMRANRGLAKVLGVARMRKTPTAIKDQLPTWLKKMVRDMSKEEGGPLYAVSRHLRAKRQLDKGSTSSWRGKVSHKNYRGSLEERDLLGPSEVLEVVYLYVDANPRFRIRVARDTVEYGLWYAELPEQVAVREKYGGPPCVDFSRYEWHLKEVKQNVKASKTIIEATTIDQGEGEGTLGNGGQPRSA